jgi:hypothetical protein
MHDDDNEVARNCKVFNDYLALSRKLGAELGTERLRKSLLAELDGR